MVGVGLVWVGLNLNPAFCRTNAVQGGEWNGCGRRIDLGEVESKPPPSQTEGGAPRGRLGTATVERFYFEEAAERVSAAWPFTFTASQICSILPSGPIRKVL